MSRWRDGEGMATHERSDLPRPRRKKPCPHCTEAAAFLDAMAKRLEIAPKGMSFKDAAECRTQARKLRGET